MTARADRSPLRPHRRAGRWGGALLLLLALGLAAALALVRSAPQGLLQVETPADGVRLGVGGTELLVRFPQPERVEAATFRARLNGADVTSGLEVAGNGAHGRLLGLLDGENRLELAVFGRAWWSPRVLVEQRRVLHLRYRPPLDWDRG